MTLPSASTSPRSRAGVGRAALLTVAIALLFGGSPSDAGSGGAQVSDRPGRAASELPRRATEGLFVVRCSFSHRLADDPITFPGERGASHVHDFLGNTSTNAESTLRSLRRAGTLCHRPGDRSAYWAPTLYERGIAVKPTTATTYYLTAGRDPATIVAPPAGLRVVAGIPGTSGSGERSVVDWTCVQGARTGEQDRALRRQGRIAHLRKAIRRHRRMVATHRRALRRLHESIREEGRAPRTAAALHRHRRLLHRVQHALRDDGRALADLRPRRNATVPRCPDGTVPVLQVRFPDCWDGNRLDSRDHASHVVYADYPREQRRLACPASHPVAIPRLVVNVHYPTRGGRWVDLSSGPGSTAHADFFNAWEEATLVDLVRHCINAGVRCGTS